MRLGPPPPPPPTRPTHHPPRYIDEAHGSDEWPISSARFNGTRGPVQIPQTRTLAERREAAANFSRDFGFADVPGVQTLIDRPGQGGEEGAFQRALSPWPVRFYILQAGKMRFVSEPGSNSDILFRPFADALRLASAKEW